MPKIKTHKGTAKRFRVTSHQSHILEKKSAKRKRAFSGTREVNPADARAIKRVAPYL